MTDDKFIALVYEMRAAQRDYFRFRTGSLLKICKELEKKVDEEIKRIKQNSNHSQASLL